MANEPPKDEGLKSNIKEDERGLINQMPAVFANRLFVNVGPTLARITFGEQTYPDDPVAMRTAVVLAMPDAIALRDLLTRLIKNTLDQLEDREKDGKSDGQ